MTTPFNKAMIIILGYDYYFMILLHEQECDDFHNADALSDGKHCILYFMKTN